MSRTELLLRLYRLAMHPPKDDAVGPLTEWLASRQKLMDELKDAAHASPFDPSLERALAALIVHADGSTHDRLVACKRQIATLMKRKNGRSYTHH